MKHRPEPCYNTMLEAGCLVGGFSSKHGLLGSLLSNMYVKAGYDLLIKIIKK